MSKLPSDLEMMEEESVRRVAHIVGESSAAAKALNRHAEMKAEGLNPVFGYSRKHSCFIVCDIGKV